MEDEFERGQMLAGRFRLVRKLGEGAVGHVWMARDTLLHDEPIACKLLVPSFSEDRRAISDLKREVLLTRKLRHANIVSIYSFWESEHTRFITMEYVEGKNLSQMLAARESPFTLADILPWFERICSALDYAHLQGILHRDVKPANILMTREDDVRLADFGIARTAREARSRVSGHVTSGTLLFMSPEQLMGEPLDQRSDVYSLAATLYELLSGAPPFYKGAIVSQIQSKEPAPIPFCGDTVNRIVRKGLKKNPQERYASSGALFAELAAVAQYHSGAHRSREHDRWPLATVVDPNAETVSLSTERADTKPLGALLMDAGLVTEEQLVEALLKHEATRERLGAVLVQLGYVSAEILAETLGEQLRIKPVLLTSMEPDPELLALVSVQAARLHRAVPLRREGVSVVVAMADPLDFHALNALEACLGSPVEPRIATEADIATAIDGACGLSGIG
jgi:predicted Ser/Thr protein kinase